MNPSLAVKRGLTAAVVLLAPLFAPAQPGAVAPLSQSKDTVRVAVAQMTIKPGDLQPGQDAVDALVPG